MSIGRNSTITTVITPATNFDLTTLLNVKTDLSIPDTDPTIDIYLRRCITQISGAVASECNRVWAYQVYQDQIRLARDVADFAINTSPEYLTLRKNPVVSVISVTEDGTLLVLGTDYEVDIGVGRVYRLNSSGNQTVWSSQKIVIQYGAGWTLPSALVAGPNLLLVDAPEVEEAVINLVKARYLSKDRDPFLKSDEVTGVGAQTFWIPNVPSGAFPPDIADLLDNYRDPVMA